MMIETFLFYFLLGCIVVLLFFAVSRLIEIASTLEATLYWLREFVSRSSFKRGDQEVQE